LHVIGAANGAVLLRGACRGSRRGAAHAKCDGNGDVGGSVAHGTQALSFVVHPLETPLLPLRSGADHRHGSPAE
jgi:hypothetical protein